MNTLVSETRALSIAGIRRRLRASIVGRQLYLCGKVESTNATLSRLARSGAPEGTVVLAEAQTAGRGRLGQPWFSPPDVNLYASVLFRGPLALKEAPLFSLIGGLALAERCGRRVRAPAIKWPNDVLVDGRKVGGSLIECVARGDEVEYLIVGVGANLNVDLDALAPPSGPPQRVRRRSAPRPAERWTATPSPPRTSMPSMTGRAATAARGRRPSSRPGASATSSRAARSRSAAPASRFIGRVGRRGSVAAGSSYRTPSASAARCRRKRSASVTEPRSPNGGRS